MQTEKTLDDIMPCARKVLIAIFNCYGDSFIGAKISSEFIEKWSSDDRKFLVVTPPHLAPHIRAICPGAEVFALNRKNPFHWLRLAYAVFVTHGGFDIGFNPNSFAKESCRIIKWAKQSKQWKAWSNHSRKSGRFGDTLIPNYYDKVRAYFDLALQGEFRSSKRAIIAPNKILVCPDSGEKRRSLTADQIERLIKKVRASWPDAIISVATSDRSRAANFELVLLDKTKEASQRYLSAIAGTDLVITVDSGTLHLADALGKQLICLFSSSMPATVLNHGANAIAARSERLDGLYCEIRSCQNPRCLDEVVADFDAHLATNSAVRRVETSACPVTGSGN